VEFDDDNKGKGVGATFETSVAKGKVKELRLGFRVGEGFREQKDLVLQDAAVWVDLINSGHFVWLGADFVKSNLTNGVYTCGADNAWRLLGRVKPELLDDVKSRKK
jgi:hypothetical protein